MVTAHRDRKRQHWISLARSDFWREKLRGGSLRKYASTQVVDLFALAILASITSFILCCFSARGDQWCKSYCRSKLTGNHTPSQYPYPVTLSWLWQRVGFTRWTTYIHVSCMNKKQSLAKVLTLCMQSCFSLTGGSRATSGHVWRCGNSVASSLRRYSTVLKKPSSDWHKIEELNWRSMVRDGNEEMNEHEIWSDEKMQRFVRKDQLWLAFNLVVTLWFSHTKADLVS